MDGSVAAFSALSESDMAVSVTIPMELKANERPEGLEKPSFFVLPY
jgi:hypothetical protein